jgi:hypothetical protein
MKARFIMLGLLSGLAAFAASAATIHASRTVVTAPGQIIPLCPPSTPNCTLNPQKP